MTVRLIDVKAMLDDLAFTFDSDSERELLLFAEIREAVNDLLDAPLMLSA